MSGKWKLQNWRSTLLIWTVCLNTLLISVNKSSVNMLKVHLPLIIKFCPMLLMAVSRWWPVKCLVLKTNQCSRERYLSWFQCLTPSVMWTKTSLGLSMGSNRIIFCVCGRGGRGFKMCVFYLDMRKYFLLFFSPLFGGMQYCFSCSRVRFFFRGEQWGIWDSGINILLFPYFSHFGSPLCQISKGYY